MGDSSDKVNDKDMEPAPKSLETSSNNPEKKKLADINNDKSVQLSSNSDIQTKAPITDENNKDSGTAKNNTTIAPTDYSIAMDTSENATESAKTATKSTTNAIQSSVSATESDPIDSSIDMDTSGDAIESVAIVIESSAKATIFTKAVTKSTTNAIESSAKATESAPIDTSIAMDMGDATESAAIAIESSANATISANTATKSTTNATEMAPLDTSTTMNTSVSAIESAAIAIESSKNATVSATNATKAMELEIRTDNSVFIISASQGPEIRIDTSDSSLNDPNIVVNKTVPTTNLKSPKSIYTEEKNIGFYEVPKKYTTPPIVPKKLPAAFESMKFLSSFEKSSDDEVDRKNVLKDFVGSDLSDENFDKLEMYCNPDHLKSGLDLHLDASFPNFQSKIKIQQLCDITDEGKQLNTVAKTNMRNKIDKSNRFMKGLIYRGAKFNPNEKVRAEPEPGLENLAPVEPPLVPGKDLLFKIRIYKPYPYNPKKKIETVSRHPMLSHDLIIHGRQTLEVVRDQFRCANDLGLRVDVSRNPYHCTATRIANCQDIFPSAFLFINNVFYDDTRPGCQPHSSVIREWAARRGVGVYPALPLNGVQIQDLEIRLGYPEVFVHQGDCEHLFTFSQIRLVGPDDVLDPSHYPTNRILPNPHIIYCTTCSDYVAKWIVVGSERTPFDPAFYCDTCFPLYMYKNDEKIGDFRAYPYIANEASKLSS